MKEIGLFIVCVFFMVTTHAQKQTVEEEFEDCYFNAFPDKGAKLKSLYKEFEIKLIQRNVLQDSTSQGYLDLFKYTFRGTYIPPIEEYSFKDSIQNLGYPEEIIFVNRKCAQQVINRDDFLVSKIYGMEQMQDSINKLPLGYEQPIELIIATYSKENFASDYTKLRVLLEVESNMEEPIEMEPLEDEISLSKIKRDFEVFLNSNDQIEMLTTNYGTADLKSSLKVYFNKQKEESTVKISVAQSASYGEYKKLKKRIKDTFNEVKNEYSLKKFQLEYKNLTEQDKQQVDKIYVVKIVDHE